MSFKFPLPKKKVIDAHVHVWSAQDVDTVVGEARRLGLRKICVSSLMNWDWSSTEMYGIGNELVFEAANRCPEVLGYVYVDPRDSTKAISEIDRYLSHGAMIGVKLWIACRANDRRVHPIAEAAEKNRLIVLTHAWRRGTKLQKGCQTLPCQVGELASSFPGVEFIMAHIGGDWENGAREISEEGNVSVDICGTINEAGMVEFAVECLGPERVLFGSDAPGSGYLPNLGKVVSADLDDSDKARILWENMERLVGRRGIEVSD